MILLEHFQDSGFRSILLLQLINDMNLFPAQLLIRARDAPNQRTLLWLDDHGNEQKALSYAEVRSSSIKITEFFLRLLPLCHAGYLCSFVCRY